ncbi:MAG: hypothetical protein RR415_11300, partial [Ruthenibacterium sp.]
NIIHCLAASRIFQKGNRKFPKYADPKVFLSDAFGAFFCLNLSMKILQSSPCNPPVTSPSHLVNRAYEAPQTLLYAGFIQSLGVFCGLLSE